MVDNTALERRKGIATSIHEVFAGLRASEGVESRAIGGNETELRQRPDRPHPHGLHYIEAALANRLEAEVHRFFHLRTATETGISLPFSCVESKPAGEGLDGIGSLDLANLLAVRLSLLGNRLQQMSTRKRLPNRIDRQTKHFDAD